MPVKDVEAVDYHFMEQMEEPQTRHQVLQARGVCVESEPRSAKREA
jgi:hypothetical protein